RIGDSIRLREVLSARSNPSLGSDPNERPRFGLKQFHRIDVHSDSHISLWDDECGRQPHLRFFTNHRTRCIVLCAIYKASKMVVYMTIRCLRISALFSALTLPTLTFGATLDAAMQAAAPAAEARSAPEQLTADTQRVTAAGASFMVPAGWSVVTGKN